MEENEYSDLLNYLSRKAYPRGYSDNQKKTLRRKAKNYEFISGELYYYLRNAAIPHKVLLTRESRLKAIATAHNEEDSGRHHGIQKTTTRLLNELHCYWRGFTKDIRIFVKECMSCKLGSETGSEIQPENNNFLNFSSVGKAADDSIKGNSHNPQLLESASRTDQSCLPGLQCRECNLHFTSKISFRIHQRKHAEGSSATALTPQATEETKTADTTAQNGNTTSNCCKDNQTQPLSCSLENNQPLNPSGEALTHSSADFSHCTYRELNRSSSTISSVSSSSNNSSVTDVSAESSSADSSDPNMGSMTFKEEGLAPILGDNQEGLQFPNSNPVFPVPDQNYSHKDVIAPAKAKFDFSDAHRTDSWIRTADETLKRIKEENPSVSQWWPHHHHHENLVRHDQWKNSNHASSAFCSSGDSHYIPPVPDCNRPIGDNNGLIQDMSRPRLPEENSCMVPHVPPITPTTATSSYPMMPVSNKSTCECPNCKEARPTPNENQSTSQKLKVHSCHICTKVFRKTWHLKAHVRTHTGERPFACQWPNCGKRFTRSDKLHRHMGMHTGERRFACFVCSKRFVRNDTLTQHLKTHNIYTNSASLQNTNGSTMDPSQMNCGDPANPNGADGTNVTKLPPPCKLKLYNCTYPGCDRVFKKTWHLKAHMCTHTGEKPFVCTWPFCGKRFTRSDKLHRHMGSHTNGKQIYCPMCNKHIGHNDYITHHLQMHDSKDAKPPIGFNATLYENTQGSTFVVNNAANNNMFVHQGNLSEALDIKPAIANLLDASMAHLHSGPTKIRIHKPSGKTYGCQMDGCNKVFKKSWHLKAHVRTHTGERPFACQWPLCGKRFARSDKLYRHMTLHTEGKRFPCTLCSKRFVRKDNLKQHMKTHFKKNLKKTLPKDDKNQRQLVSLVSPPSLHSFYPP